MINIKLDKKIAAELCKGIFEYTKNNLLNNRDFNAPRIVKYI